MPILFIIIPTSAIYISRPVSNFIIIFLNKHLFYFLVLEELANKNYFQVFTTFWEEKKSNLTEKFFDTIFTIVYKIFQFFKNKLEYLIWAFALFMKILFSQLYTFLHQTPFPTLYC